MRVQKFKWSPSGRKVIKKQFAQLKEECANLFYYKSDAEARILDFILLPAVSLQWDMQNPLWVQVIGSPGSGKTAHISLYEDWPKAKFVSRLTKNSLISGYRPDDDPDADPSFLNELDGNLFVIKDFTCILQGPREERDAIIGQLRDIYDGRASRVFGTLGLVEYESRFNMILAVTNIIDGFYAVNSQLGERFISRREYSLAREEITQAAFDNIVTSKYANKFGGLKEVFMNFASRIPNVPIDGLYWSQKMKQRAIVGANFIAGSRSHVIREKDGTSIASRPSPEVGSRLVTQIVQCVASFCICSGRTKVNTDAWDFGGARILRDTLPSAIAWTLYNIYLISKSSEKYLRTPKFSIKELLPMTRLGWKTTERIITDLHHNGILSAEYRGRTGRRNPYYYLTEESFAILEFTRLFVGYSDEEIDISTLPLRTRRRERIHKGTLL